jgi:hypothetical protein
MKKARFDKAFARFIRHGEAKITPEVFFAILAEIEHPLDSEKKQTYTEISCQKGKQTDDHNT